MTLREGRGLRAQPCQFAGAQLSEGKTPSPATTGRRFASALIDGSVLLVVLVAGIVLLGDMSDPVRTAKYVLLAAMFVQLLPEILLARTVGKLVTGTRVVDFDGNTPPVRQLLGS